MEEEAQWPNGWFNGILIVPLLTQLYKWVLDTEQGDRVQQR